MTFERAISAILTLAIAGMAIAIGHREFRRWQSLSREPELPPPEYVADWKKLSVSAVYLGDGNAPLQLIEFVDLQCPVCRQFHGVLKKVRRRYGAELSVGFVHYPLSYHKAARPAAQALQCARRQGAFEGFMDVTFAKQESLGVKPWTSFGAEAGVRDTEAFRQCVVDTAAVPEIEAGVLAGKIAEVRGTPTVLVNGWRYRFAPRERVLVRLIEELRSGRRLPPSSSVSAREP